MTTLNSSQSLIRSCRGGEPPAEVIPATQASTVVVGVSGVVVVCTVVSSAVVDTSLVGWVLVVCSDVSSTDSVVIPSNAAVVPSEDALKVAKVVVDSASSDDEDSEIGITEDSEVESSTSSDVVEATSSMLDRVPSVDVRRGWIVVTPKLEVDGSTASEERVVASFDTMLLS